MKDILNILIVEDSEDDAQWMLHELSKNGWNLHTERVETANEMRSEIENAPWDLILADHTLPQFSAPAALDLLKESGLDIPFIVVSGTIGEEKAVELMKAGAHDYINKSNLVRLTAAVERELRDAQIRAQRIQVQKDLKEMMGLYSSMAENLPGILYRIFLGAKNRIQFFNQMLEPITGYHSSELHKNNLPPLISLVLPQDLQYVSNAIEETIQGDNPFQVTYRIRHKSGEIRFIYERSKSSRNDEGIAAFLDGIILDVTSHIRFKELMHLRTQNIQLICE